MYDITEYLMYLLCSKPTKSLHYILNITVYDYAAGTKGVTIAKNLNNILLCTMALHHCQKLVTPKGILIAWLKYMGTL